MKTITAIPSKLTPFTMGMLGIVGIGIVIGLYIDPKINIHKGSLPIVKWGEFILSIGDVIVFAIGLCLMLFGGKIHRYVRYLGLGIFVSKATFELRELTRINLPQ